jgi:hypothetical protein
MSYRSPVIQFYVPFHIVIGQGTDGGHGLQIFMVAANRCIE